MINKYEATQLKKEGDHYLLSVKDTELQDYYISGEENKLMVRAFNKTNDISSRGVIVEKKAIAKDSTPPNLYAVMIGVSKYKGGKIDLKYAAKDAIDLSAVLYNSAKRLLNSDTAEHVFMYNLTSEKGFYKKPEKLAIKQTLEEISKKSKANDILLIFFAGHGVTAPANDLSRKENFYFLTANASESIMSGPMDPEVGISTEELTEWIKPASIKAQKRILMFDACNSGRVINEMYSVDKQKQTMIGARGINQKVQLKKAIDKLNEQSGLLILSASATDQPAYEVSRYGQGLLTYALLRSIKQQPDILVDKKFLDVSRWFNASREAVSDLSKEIGARQQPQFISTTNFAIGIVDTAVIAGIHLPGEKPTFSGSNFKNNDPEIADDDLGLINYVDQQLSETASRGAEPNINFNTIINSSDLWTLSGGYSVTADSITIKVLVKQNNVKKYDFKLAGLKTALRDLSFEIVQRSVQWISDKKNE